jgi:hypothetical protein
LGEVFAGIVCGYIAALVGAPILALNLAQLRASSLLVQRMMPAGTPMVALTIVLHGALILSCAGAGIILGLLLYAMNDAGGGLGSPNIAFTLFVFGATVMLFAPAVVVIERFRRQALVVALVVVLLFGWLMPYVAQWSKFDSS